MLEEYPKRFSFTGVVELTYTDYYYGLPSRGSKIEYNSSFFEQRYGLSVRGFIYHPRLAVFNAGINYRDERQLAHTNTGGKINSHDIGYDLRLTFLPYRPVSLAVYAGNNDYTMQPIGNFINSQWAFTQHINYNFYGARLKISKPPFPFMRLEYNHQAQDIIGIGNTSGKLQTDEFVLDVRGNLRFWQTVYLGTFQYVDFSSPTVSYKAKTIQLSSSSTIKNGLYLYNSFNYSDIDNFKLLSFGTQLNIDQGQLLKQFYYYNYLQSREHFEGLAAQGIAGQNEKETKNSITGSWVYRFVNGPVTSLSLNYGDRTRTNGTDEKANYYGLSFSVSYGRSFLGLNFSPSYRLIYRKDELKGELLQNNVELSLVTKKIRWGTIYADYSFTYSKEVDQYRENLGDQSGSFETKTTKLDTISHVFRTGVRGRGPGKRFSKARWNIEAEILYSDSTIERQRPDFFFDEDMVETPTTERYKRSIRRYSLRGNTSYPVGWATIFFSAGVSIGESNGARLSKYFYEERVSYPILKNCYLLVKWKEMWEKVAESPTRRVDEYDLTAEYRIGQTTISASGAVLKTSADAQELNIRRFYLRLRRTIF
jgi:hypothetical protein